VSHRVTEQFESCYLADLSRFEHNTTGEAGALDLTIPPAWPWPPCWPFSVWLAPGIGKRLLDCGPELHSDKTQIVFCKDDLRKGRHQAEKLIFLGTKSNRGNQS
jgi:hypothetical protein